MPKRLCVCPKHGTAMFSILGKGIGMLILSTLVTNVSRFNFWALNAHKNMQHSKKFSLGGSCRVTLVVAFDRAESI